MNRIVCATQPAKNPRIEFLQIIKVLYHQKLAIYLYTYVYIIPDVQEL